VLEDLGLFTFPGRCRPDCDTDERGPGGRCSSPINVSTAYRMMRIRGSFGASMEFRRFPYDRQALEVLVRAPANTARDEYVLVPKATVDPALIEMQAKSGANDPNDPGKDVIAGWRVVAITSSEAPYIANTTFWAPGGFHNDDSAKRNPFPARMGPCSD